MRDFLLWRSFVSVQPTSGCMNQMITAYGCGITITGENHHLQIRIMQLDAGCPRECSAMNTVKNISLHINRNPGRAPNTTDSHQFIKIQADLICGL